MLTIIKKWKGPSPGQLYKNSINNLFYKFTGGILMCGTNVNYMPTRSCLTLEQFNKCIMEGAVVPVNK